MSWTPPHTFAQPSPSYPIVPQWTYEELAGTFKNHHVDDQPTASAQLPTPTSSPPIPSTSPPAYEIEQDDIILDSPYPWNVTGRFCDLFVGEHRTAGKVALKRPRIARHDEAQVRAFHREARTWKALKHTNILQFLGIWQGPCGQLYLVSVYADNGTVIDYLKVNPNADRLKFLAEIADAVAYLHSGGVIHGDLKGRNILVSTALSALLCDFGLTKAMPSRTSTSLKGSGSVRWQSPELWEENSSKTYGSDTYAFGITIYEILSGQVPFHEFPEDAGVIMAVAIRNRRPPKEPDSSLEGVAYNRAWVVAERCWARDPSRRPPMATVLQLLHLIPTTGLADERQQPVFQDSMSKRPRDSGIREPSSAFRKRARPAHIALPSSLYPISNVTQDQGLLEPPPSP